MGNGGEQVKSLTRAELYALIWAEPLTKVAAKLEIPAAKLSQLCDTHAIARPDQGHWLRVEMGKPLRIHPLAAAPAGVAQTVLIAPAGSIRTFADRAHQSKRPHVPERLIRPHAVVAAWIATRERDVRDGEPVYDPLLKRTVTPVPLTAADRRRLRIADTIFKTVERRGVTVTLGERRALEMTLGGERIEVQLRYRLRRAKHPLRDDELRWRRADAPAWVFELVETDALLFEIKTWLPSGSSTEWEDSHRGKLEDRLPELIEGIMTAFPTVEALRREREAEQLRYEAVARERREREETLKQDAARFGRLLEMAADWRKAALARRFVASLCARLAADGDSAASGPSTEWLAWADRKIAALDPMMNSPAVVMDAIDDPSSAERRHRRTDPNRRDDLQT